MKKFLILIPILLVHILILSQLKFTAWPEMFSYPYLLGHGFSLYKDFIMPYPPGLILILMGFFSFFSSNPDTLKILTWVFVIVSDIVLFLILFNLKLKKEFLLLLMFFYISTQSFLDGNMLWFDFATVPFLLLVFLFSLKWLDSKNVKYLFLIGFTLSLAILVKQIALVYLVLFIVFFLTAKYPVKNLFYLLFGLLIPLILFLVYLLTTDSLIDFWNWTIYYPLFEWSNFPGYVVLKATNSERLVIFLLIIPLSFLIYFKKLIFTDPKVKLALTFLVAAILAIYPRFSYFHLQPVLAFETILVALFLVNIRKRARLVLIMAIILVITGMFILVGRRQVSSQVVFRPDHRLEDLIEKNSMPGDRIYLLGFPSNEYVFTKRLPPVNWSDNFGWYLEIPGVSEWVLKGFKSTPPQAIFWKTPLTGNWYDLGVYQPELITEFIRTNYERREIVGDIEIWLKK